MMTYACFVLDQHEELAIVLKRKQQTCSSILTLFHGLEQSTLCPTQTLYLGLEKSTSKTCSFIDTLYPGSEKSHLKHVVSLNTSSCLRQVTLKGVGEITLFSVSSQIYDHLCVWKFPLNSKLLGDKACLHWIWPVKKMTSFPFTFP